MLTMVQRRRLAREARKLAMECVENGPQMDSSWCGCAIGITLARAGLGRGVAEPIDEYCNRASALDYLPSLEPMMLSSATNERLWKNNPTAVVFPLLALADALEESP